MESAPLACNPLQAPFTQLRWRQFAQQLSQISWIPLLANTDRLLGAAAIMPKAASQQTATLHAVRYL